MKDTNNQKDAHTSYVGMPWFGINWGVDTRIHAYDKIFDSGEIQKTFEQYMTRTFSPGFHIRYPGGAFVQEFDMDPANFGGNVSWPSPEIFLKFCSSSGLKVLQQLPTTALARNGSIQKVHSSNGKIDWGIVDNIVQDAVKYCRWIKANQLWDTVIAFEIGNEDYAVMEGEFSPDDYVETVARYISGLSQIDQEIKLIIDTRPAGSNDWGRAVLRLIKARNLEKAIFGFATHVYPGWTVPALNRKGIDFHNYILSEQSSFAKNNNYSTLVENLNNLGYPPDHKIFITECGLDLTLFDFQSNKKDFSCAVGLVKDVIELIQSPRFGGLSYTGLFHQYLIQKQKLKGDGQVYSNQVTDWGLGELWFLPDESGAKFVGTPLLDVLGVLSKGLCSCSRYGRLKTAGNTEAILALKTTGQYFLLFVNLSSAQTQVDLQAEANVNLLYGGLGARTLPLGATSLQSGSMEEKAYPLVSPAGLSFPAYAIAYTYLTSGKLNGLPISGDLIGFKAIKDGEELNLGDFGVLMKDGRLEITPKGATVSGLTWRLLSSDRDELTKLIGVDPDDITEWTTREK